MGATAPSARPIAPSGASLGSWHPVRRQVMLYRIAQATDILLPRWHQQRAPEVMLYRSVQHWRIQPSVLGEANLAK